MSKNVKLVVLAVVLALVPAASATVVITGDLYWVGNYGACAAPVDGPGVPTYAAGNLARGPLVTAIASGVIADGALPPHQIANIKDGNYGNSYSWIPGTATPGWAGVALGQTVLVSSIAFSRSNTQSPFLDRVEGVYKIQYTTAAVVNGASAWTTIGTVTYDVASPETCQRKEYAFTAVEATGFRIVIESGSGPYLAALCIDEIELYVTDLDRCKAIRPVPSIGSFVAPGSDLLLKWDVSADGAACSSGTITGYHVYYDLDPSELYPGMDGDKGIVTAQEYLVTAAELEVNKNYSWRVDVIYDNGGVGNVVQGNVWNFTFGFEPVTRVGPRDGGLETNGWKLAWKNGFNAFDSYDVYLGTDFDAVNNADNSRGPCVGIGDFPGDFDGDCDADIDDLYILANGWLATYDLTPFADLAGNWLNANPYKGNRAAAEYWHSNLKVGETYYWRIDGRLGSTTTKSDVWSFDVVEKWKPTRFVVGLGWVLGAYATNLNTYYQSLSNLGLTTLMDSAFLDQANTYGMNIDLYYGPTGPAIADQFKNHPATWGYHQYDEPHIANPVVTDAQVAAQHLSVHWADPTKPSLTNIQSINYGLTRTKAQSFIDTVHPEILSFDYYQWYWTSNTLIENLEWYRKRALEKNIPLFSWVEVDAKSTATTNERRRRYSVYTNLVYGVKGIWWFTKERIYNQNGTILNTTYYNDVKAINVQINNLGPYLVGLTSTAVYHTGKGSGTKDWTGTTDPMLTIPAGNWVQITTTPITLGMFSGMPGYECIMITSRDITNIKSVTVTFKDAVSKVEAFDAINNSWSNLTIGGTYPNQTVTQSLDQGCGKLLRIVKQ